MDEQDIISAELFSEAPEPVARKPRRVVADEPRLHPVLSNAEVREAQEVARAEIAAESRAAARKGLIAAEKERLQQEEGLVTGDGTKDEMVSVTLDLAEHSAVITLSGRPYHHGHTYTVPRHVADTLREVMARGHDHQNEIEGKAILDRFRRPRLTGLSPIRGVTNAAPRVSV